ncbi:hypothetical protein EDB86DRAFT_508243 [Lactarius hatsudake]|nr:hypothetical protein EDB86DRAFT_508243 [Lactarius hatsudake]
MPVRCFICSSLRQLGVAGLCSTALGPVIFRHSYISSSGNHIGKAPVPRVTPPEDSLPGGKGEIKAIRSLKPRMTMAVSTSRPRRRSIGGDNFNDADNYSDGTLLKAALLLNTTEDAMTLLWF